MKKASVICEVSHSLPEKISVLWDLRNAYCRQHLNGPGGGGATAVMLLSSGHQWGTKEVCPEWDRVPVLLKQYLSPRKWWSWHHQTQETEPLSMQPIQDLCEVLEQISSWFCGLKNHKHSLRHQALRGTTSNLMQNSFLWLRTRMWASLRKGSQVQRSMRALVVKAPHAWMMP